MKCYPIDLASQVDANGNIYIDRDTNTPMNTGDVLNDVAKGAQQLPRVSDVPNVNDPSSIQNRNIILYICISVIVITIMVVAIGYLASIVLRSNTVDEAARAALAAARAANAAAGPVLNAELPSR